MRKQFHVTIFENVIRRNNLEISYVFQIFCVFSIKYLNHCGNLQRISNGTTNVCVTNLVVSTSKESRS